MRSILVIAGASGVGKTTVAKKVIGSYGSFELVRSATTRAPRKDGNDAEYLYLSREEFLERAEKGEMLEYTEYGANLYGTPTSELDRIIEDGKIPLLILDLNGIRSIKEGKSPFFPIVFYIYEELDNIEKRLRFRESQNPAADGSSITERRMQANRADYLSLPDMAYMFNAFIKNTDVDTAAKELFDAFGLALGGKYDRSAENLKIAKELYKQAL